MLLLQLDSKTLAVYVVWAPGALYPPGRPFRRPFTVHVGSGANLSLAARCRHSLVPVQSHRNPHFPLQLTTSLRIRTHLCLPFFCNPGTSFFFFFFCCTEMSFTNTIISYLQAFESPWFCLAEIWIKFSNIILIYFLFSWEIIGAS